MTWDLKTLRRRLGGTGFCGDLIVSTATGGSSTTVVDTKIVAGEGLYKYATIQMITGPAAGDTRKVTNWAAATNTFTVDRAFTGTPVSGNEYEIHTVFGFEDKNSALNEAIRDAALRWPNEIEDATLTTVTNQFTYDVSALTYPIDPLLGVDEVWEETFDPRTGAPWNRMDEGMWALRNTTPMLLQLSNVPNYPTKKLRLIYRTRPAQLTTDASVLNPDVDELANFLCTRAAALLFERRSQIEGEDTTRGQWAVRAMDLNVKSSKLLTLDAPQKHLGKVVFSTWGDEPDTTANRLNTLVGRMRV